MPCDEIREVTVNLIVADEGVLLRALKAAGFTGVTFKAGTISGYTQSGARFEIESGQVVMTGSYITERAVEKVAAEVKVAYAQEAVRTAAKQYGWTTSPSKIKPGATQLSKKSW